MARRRKTYRRRRGRFSFLLKFLCFALVLAALIGALTAFFKVDQIIISGNEKYSDEQILEVSDIAIGDNMFLMNKFAVAQTVFEKLPYVETTSIQRKLPDTLLIDVKECSAAALVKAENGSYLISAEGKILEQAKKAPDACAKVKGATLVNPTISATAEFAEEESYKCKALLSLLHVAAEKRICENINAIDLSDGEYLQFEYLDRFTVKLPWDADMDYKLESLASVVDYLEGNETGTINLMTEGKASFIPK